MKGRKRALPLYRPFFVGVLSLFLVSRAIGAEPPVRFRLVSWNVENLFDLSRSGKEYVGYIPNTGYGWNPTTASVKYANVARVLASAKADVAVLSEVESPEALARLQKKLSAIGHPLVHGAISRRPVVVRCAVLSRFPILETHEVKTGPERRPVLRVSLNIKGRTVVIYANHWRSKRGPESERVASAHAVLKDIKKWPLGTDYMLAGDFNSDYNEWQTFRDNARLNDTSGLTGINHILGTLKDDMLVSKEDIRTGKGGLFNLWLEVSPEKRWNYNFFGKKGSLDHIVLPAALFDSKGVSYVDGSFGRFAPKWLFHKGGIYRWQRAKKGRGKHLGRGYSDHLPIYAEFITAPFVAQKGPAKVQAPALKRPKLVKKRIADLYNLPVGPANYRIEDAVVVYKSGPNGVIKEPSGRAVYLYKVAQDLKPGQVVALTVRHLSVYNGLREVTALSDLKVKGVVSIDSLLLSVSPESDLRSKEKTNEVVDMVCGLYRGGWLKYGHDQSIRLYFRKGIKRPKNDSLICVKQVRVGYHKGPELSVDRADQVRVR
ncbi:MAG: endonuclease/exonuclease/phosphatase family protein [Desulfobacterales bacterium]|nr:endonuclease/exonuclease/phosphatase family protein [Desulfobacterales bacterium]